MNGGIEMFIETCSQRRCTYTASQKIPPDVFWHFFSNGLEFLVQILQDYYTFLSTLDYIFYSVICNFDEVMPY